MANHATLPVISLENWAIDLHSAVLRCTTGLDLLRSIVPRTDLWPAVQGAIQDRLAADRDRLAWRRLRPKIGKLQHYKRYRKTSAYDDYHAAARALVAGQPVTASQSQMAAGLQGEITASGILLPVRQTLFHGRADRELDSAKPYPAFVSTTLDPIVALNSALRRSLPKPGSTPIVYVLTLRRSIPGLFAQSGKLGEWEVTLGYGATVNATALHNAGNFLLIEADIV